MGRNGILLTVVPLIFDPLFARLFQLDELLANSDGTKYSMVKIKEVKKDGTIDEYFNYSEGI